MRNKETVDIVASGYDWVCNKCGAEQCEDTVSVDWAEGNDHLACQSCGANYTLGDVSHAYT